MKAGRRSRAWRVPPLLLGVLLTGCQQELGPETVETTSVTGKLNVGGQPYGGVWIEFLPVDGTVGALRSAPVDELGRFQADQVAVGRVAIRLVGFPSTTFRIDPVLDGYLGQLRQAYLLHRSIPGDSGTPLVIDLAEEARRSRASRP